MFKSPNLPSFNLPSVGNGANNINVNNPIVLANGNSLSQGCNTNGPLKYWNPTTQAWVTTSFSNIISNGGIPAMLSVQNIQAQDSTIRNTLMTGKHVQIPLTCNNGYSSCIQFLINSSGSVQQYIYPQCASGAGTTTTYSPEAPAAVNHTVPYFVTNENRTKICYGYQPSQIDANLRFTDGTSHNFHYDPAPTLTGPDYCIRLYHPYPGVKIPNWNQVDGFDCHVGENNSGRTQNCFWDGSAANLPPFGTQGRRSLGVSIPAPISLAKIVHHLN
jgi:hypothetical protein